MRRWNKWGAGTSERWIFKNSWIMITHGHQRRSCQRFFDLDEGDFLGPFQGRILISYQNTRSTIKVTSKELFSIQTARSRFQILHPRPSSHYNFCNDISVNIQQFRWPDSLWSAAEESIPVRKKKPHPPYLICKKPDRVEQSDDCAKESFRKENTTSILHKGAPYQHESSINPCHPLIRIFYATALVDKTRIKIDELHINFTFQEWYINGKFFREWKKRK